MLSAAVDSLREGIAPRDPVTGFRSGPVQTSWSSAGPTARSCALSWSSPWYQCRLEGEQTGSSPAERDLLWGMKNQTWGRNVCMQPVTGNGTIRAGPEESHKSYQSAANLFCEKKIKYIYIKKIKKKRLREMGVFSPRGFSGETLSGSFNT